MPSDGEAVELELIHFWWEYRNNSMSRGSFPALHGLRKACTWMFISAKFIATSNWKQPQTGELINNLWYIQIVQCYRAIQWDELLIYPITQMNLKTVLCERIPFTWNSKKKIKLLWQKADLWLPDTGVQVGDWVERDTRELSGMMHIFYLLTVVGFTLRHKFVLTHQTVHFKWVHFVRCNFYLNKADAKRRREPF